jgi:hypothetical protein
LVNRVFFRAIVALVKITIKRKVGIYQRVIEKRADNTTVKRTRGSQEPV